MCGWAVTSSPEALHHPVRSCTDCEVLTLPYAPTACTPASRVDASGVETPVRVAARVTFAKRPRQEGSGVVMEHAGTLQISHHRTGTLGVRTYSITFISGGTPAQDWRHCRGDLALVRMLEALVSDPEVRLHALEQLHEQGRASIQPFVLSDAQAAIFGLRRTGRAGPFSAAVGRPSEAQDLERDIAGEIAAFLAEPKGRCFCHTCLATQVGIEFEEARKAVYTLRICGNVRVGTARCSVCHRHRLSIEAV